MKAVVETLTRSRTDGQKPERKTGSDSRYRVRRCGTRTKEVAKNGYSSYLINDLITMKTMGHHSASNCVFTIDHRMFSSIC